MSEQAPQLPPPPPSYAAQQYATPYPSSQSSPYSQQQPQQEQQYGQQQYGQQQYGQQQYGQQQQMSPTYPMPAPPMQTYPSYTQPMQPMQPMQQPGMYASPVMAQHTVQQTTYGSPVPQMLVSPMSPMSTTVYVQAAPGMAGPMAGPMMQMMPSSPCPCRCPNCGQQIVTRVNNKVGGITWAWAIGLCLTVGLCCIPFCVPACMDQEHFCPNCNTLVGTRQPC